MTHMEYTLLRRTLIGGSKVAVATIPVSERRIRIVQVRTRKGIYEGKYIADGKWYPIYKA